MDIVHSYCSRRLTIIIDMDAQMSVKDWICTMERISYFSKNRKEL